MIDRKTIANLLGVSAEHFRRRIECRPDFPRPALRLSRKTVRWEQSDVQRWIDAQTVRSQRA